MHITDKFKFDDLRTLVARSIGSTSRETNHMVRADAVLIAIFNYMNNPLPPTDETIPK